MAKDALRTLALAYKDIPNNESISLLYINDSNNVFIRFGGN